MSNQNKAGGKDVSNQNKTAKAAQVSPGETTLTRGLYISIKTQEEQEAKIFIAKHVVKKYIKDFDAVLLDAGSTAEIIAEEMFSTKKFLSVLTNNMGAYAAYVRAGEKIKSENAVKNQPIQGNELLISGGRYVDVYESLLGSGALSSIDDFTPNVIIIGTSGLTSEGSIFCHGSEETAVKERLWKKQTDIRLIATDWTKIGKRDAHGFGKVSELHLNAKEAVIVTNLPPKKLFEEDPERMKEFNSEIENLRKIGITVDTIQTEDQEIDPD
jgi:DeoR/GlpR family transcriptional regulator of sugar metabolism